MTRFKVFVRHFYHFTGLDIIPRFKVFVRNFHHFADFFFFLCGIASYQLEITPKNVWHQSIKQMKQGIDTVLDTFHTSQTVL
jgi:hypothetical protein